MCFELTQPHIRVCYAVSWPSHSAYTPLYDGTIWHDNAWNISIKTYNILGTHKKHPAHRLHGWAMQVSNLKINPVIQRTAPQFYGCGHIIFLWPKDTASAPTHLWNAPSTNIEIGWKMVRFCSQDITVNGAIISRKRYEHLNSLNGMCEITYARHLIERLSFWY